MDEKFTDVEMYVAAWFRKYSKMGLNGVISGRAEGGVSALIVDYEREYSVANAKARKYDEQGNKLKIPKKLSYALLEHGFNDFLTIEKQRVLAELPKQLPYIGEDDSELRRWVMAVTGAQEELDVAVIKHFLWQIKRKVNNMKVDYHLVPVLFGVQGGGKTKAVRLLTGPVSDLLIEFSPLEATDPRNAKTLSDNFVCLFDEMSSMQRVEMESLKRLITADYLTYRPMRTNDFKKIPQNTTFIGISNKSLAENVYDTTGLRRFAEIKVLDKVNWDLVNSLDYAAVWGCIDPALEGGYTPEVMTELKAHQESNKSTDSFTDFVQDNNVMPTFGTEPQLIKIIDLHRAYQHWHGTSGYNMKPALHIGTFANKLRSLGLLKKIKRIEGKDVVFYTINSTSAIFSSEFFKLKAI